MVGVSLYIRSWLWCTNSSLHCRGAGSVAAQAQLLRSLWDSQTRDQSRVSCIGRQILYHLRPLGIPRTCAWNLPNPRGEGAEEFLLQLSGGDETYPQALLTC